MPPAKVKEKKQRQPEPVVVVPIVAPMPKFLRVAIHIAAIAAAIFLGLYVRFDDLSWWKSRPDTSFKDRPILTTADAYWFTRMTKEYLAGSYNSGQPDKFRDIPDCELLSPKPIPMICFLTAQVVRITGLNVDQAAFYIPPILAVLCAIPIYLAGVELSGMFVGFAAAVLGVVFQLYLVRSCLGRFDTDCLNLFFVFAIPLFLFWSARSTIRWRKFVFAALAGVSLTLFYWWYSHAGFAIPFLFFFAVMIFWPKKGSTGSRRDKIILLLLVVLFGNPIQFYDALGSLLHFFKSHIVGSSEKFGFPNILMSVSESMNYRIMETLSEVNNGVIGLAALAGLIWLIIKVRGRFLAFLPVLGLGFLAFRSGNRFAMFLAPFLGMGLGFLAERIWVHVVERWLMKPTKGFLLARIGAAAFLVIGLLLVTVSDGAIKFHPVPRFPLYIFSGLDAIAGLSPKTGAVWTWWDWGYAIEDIARQTTYTDGGSYRKTYFVGRSLATTQPAECRNIMLGVDNIGFDGIYKEMKKQNLDSPEPVLAEIDAGKFNADSKHPIYLVFTDDMIGKFYWVYFFGTWDFTEQKGKPHGSIPDFYPQSQEGNKVICYGSQGRIEIDLDQGVVGISGGYAPLQKILISKSNEPPAVMKAFPRSEGYIGLFLMGSGYSTFYIIRPEVMDTVFVQMYLLKNYDHNLFEQVYSDFPRILVYKVK